MNLPDRAKMFAMTVGLPLCVLGLVLVMYLANSLGLPVTHMPAVVAGKLDYAPHRSYSTKIVAGRAWVQSADSADLHVVQVNAGGQKLGVAVSLAEMNSYEVGDQVTIAVRRYRLTGTLEVVQIIPSEKSGT